MIQISIRAVLIVGLLAWLTFTGELPWWVLAVVVFYQFPYAISFWLPGQRKKYIKKINDQLAVQEAAVLKRLSTQNLKPTDIN